MVYQHGQQLGIPHGEIGSAILALQRAEALLSNYFRPKASEENQRQGKSSKGNPYGPQHKRRVSGFLSSNVYRRERAKELDDVGKQKLRRIVLTRFSDCRENRACSAL
jgi:hypothetical protein